MKTLKTFLKESSQSQNYLANKLKAKFKESDGVLAFEIQLNREGAILYGHVSHDDDAITLVGVKGKNYNMMFQPDAYRTSDRREVFDVVWKVTQKQGNLNKIDPKDYYEAFGSTLKRNSKFKPW